MTSNAQRAEILVQALPYIQQYNGQIVVIKYGGNAMVNEDLKHAVMRDVVLLSLVGVKVVLIHGGGPEITEMLGKLGKASSFVDGLRVTDAETAEVVQMVLSGKINKGLVNLLTSIGGQAVGLCGMDGGMIQARPMRPELGFVGEIASINVRPILDLLEKGYIPVISSVGCDMQGNTYNINADTAAARIAGELGAACLVSMTDIAGILRNREDPQSLIKYIPVGEVARLSAQGVISGGMIPKAQCCVEAICHGVKKVFIIDGRVPHAVLIELLTDEGLGTMFEEDAHEHSENL